MKRCFNLAIEVHADVIFYNCNYDPELRNCGGYSGRIFPNGALFGLTFLVLTQLGTGIHRVELNEKLPTPRGSKPDWDEERSAFEMFRFVNFGYKCGIFTRLELAMFAMEAFSLKFSKEVLKNAPDFILDDLREYALKVPLDISTRKPSDFSFCSSSGTITRISDANLELLRKEFV